MHLHPAVVRQSSPVVSLALEQVGPVLEHTGRRSLASPDRSLMSEDMSLQDGRAALSLCRGRELDNRHADESRRYGYVGPGSALSASP
jgi:hypothetical protein